VYVHAVAVFDRVNAVCGKASFGVWHRAILIVNCDVGEQNEIVNECVDVYLCYVSANACDLDRVNGFSCVTFSILIANETVFCVCYFDYDYGFCLCGFSCFLFK
jgi:hypothetical protein